MSAPDFEEPFDHVIHRAVLGHSLTVATLLLDRGAAVPKLPDDGPERTPLAWAEKRG